MTSGMIFDIQHFCIDDGPGIRTTVFMKGCPLRCLWCHNPEGMKRERQVSYDSQKCIRCGRCEGSCLHHGHIVNGEEHRLDRSNCIGCGSCMEACPTDALRIYGRSMTVEEVLEDVLGDKPFYDNSGGGITLSGGEPLSQSAFALELLKRSKEANLHTCIETCGYCSLEVMKEAADFTDLILFDVKETDKKFHKRFTGVDNDRILANLWMLLEIGKPVILRCPVIPGCNDRKEHFEEIARLSEKMKNVQEIHLEPYHPFGLDKYGKLGMKAGYDKDEFMDVDKVKSYIDMMQQFTNVEIKIS